MQLTSRQLAAAFRASCTCKSSQKSQQSAVNGGIRNQHTLHAAAAHQEQQRSHGKVCEQLRACYRYVGFVAPIQAAA
jgi:hypothetical protein